MQLITQASRTLSQFNLNDGWFIVLFCVTSLPAVYLSFRIQADVRNSLTFSFLWWWFVTKPAQRDKRFDEDSMLQIRMMSYAIKMSNLLNVLSTNTSNNRTQYLTASRLTTESRFCFFHGKYCGFSVGNTWISMFLIIFRRLQIRQFEILWAVSSNDFIRAVSLRGKARAEEC